MAGEFFHHFSISYGGVFRKTPGFSHLSHYSISNDFPCKENIISIGFPYEGYPYSGKLFFPICHYAIIRYAIPEGSAYEFRRRPSSLSATDSTSGTNRERPFGM
jgi:hypothetical protein